MKKQQGFSTIEVILAAALFIIFTSGTIGVVIQGIGANRLGVEHVVATQYAAEGIEAARSIKNQGYTNLINTSGTGIIRNGSNVWQFSGSNNTFDSSRYTRVIKVEDVRRDAAPPLGNIIAAGGTIDTNTKKITATVNWNFTGARPESVELISYLSDWRKTITNNRNGLLVYGDNQATPQYRTYDNTANTFGAETNTAVGAIGRNFIVRTSPTQQEAIAGYVTSGGVLRIMCYNGSSWSEEWTTTVGGTGTTRRFDISYETNSGDAVILYSTNTASTNELAYRTKAGSTNCGSTNWSGAATLDPVRTTGVIQWVKVAWDKRSSSNLITALFADANADLSAMIWSGTAWGNEPLSALSSSLEFVAAAQDVDSFDVDYETTSGDVMVAWGISGSGTTNLIKYVTCPGGSATCTWDASSANIPTISDAGTNLDISTNPNTNEIVLGAIDKGTSDLSVAYWSGSAWTGSADFDNNVQLPLAGTKLVTTGWLISGATTRSIIVYHDNNERNIGWIAGNGSTFTVQTDFEPTPQLDRPQHWYDLQTDPFNKDRLLLTLSDNSSDLFAARLVMTAAPAFTWTDADGGVVLEASLDQAIAAPFSYAYWRNP